MSTKEWILAPTAKPQTQQEKSSPPPPPPPPQNKKKKKKKKKKKRVQCPGIFCDVAMPLVSRQSFWLSG